MKWLLLMAVFDLNLCIKQATWACQDAVSHDPALEEAADGTHSSWLKDCRESAVNLCLIKADKAEHFGKKKAH